jgi:hypothetical protein
MGKYICLHTVPGGSMTREQVCQLADAAQHDENVRGYRSFINLSEGKVVCILEADDADAIDTWFNKMQVPYDTIVPLELEGERGDVHDLRRESARAGAH